VMPAGAAAWPDGALALAARRLLRQAAPWGPRADRELPGLAAAIGLIWRESFETIPLDAWAARSTRDPGLWPMGLLLSRQPTDPATGEFWTLDAASFLRSLATARGMEPLARWYRDARRADVHELFKEIYGESLRDAENRWLKSLKSGDAAARREPKGSSASAVHDPEAARLAAAARAAFREGAFDRAALLSEKVLAMEAASAEDKAWAGVTLGRAHARSGRHAAAIIWLRDERTRGGSETVRVLADYWLEILGRPLNGRAARDALMRDAELQLLGFDWEKAESSLQAALALDPLNRKAHTMLGQVYLSKFQYWYDFALLDRELHPSVSSADPYMYQYLADKGRTELARAETLPDDLPGNPAMLDAEDVALSTDSMASSHFLAGKAHYLRGDLEAARREMETVLELDRTRGSLPAYARLYLARVAQTRGDQEEARRQLEAIVKMAPAGRVTRLAREALEKLPPPAR
ncbi:MAG: tetratricopeptide repeat protein, partial [Candidatus Polarisedimenticolia bacterium]